MDWQKKTITDLESVIPGPELLTIQGPVWRSFPQPDHICMPRRPSLFLLGCSVTRLKLLVVLLMFYQLFYKYIYIYINIQCFEIAFFIDNVLSIPYLDGDVNGVSESLFIPILCSIFCWSFYLLYRLWSCPNHVCNKKEKNIFCGQNLYILISEKYHIRFLLSSAIICTNPWVRCPNFTCLFMTCI